MEGHLVRTSKELMDRESWLRDLALSLYYMRDRRGMVDSFLDRVGERLAIGEREYGNASFARSPDEIVREILAETLDRAGWCYVLEGSCRTQLARDDLSSTQRQRITQLAEASKQIRVDAFDAFLRDSELLDPPQPVAHLDERDGGWTDAD